MGTILLPKPRHYFQFTRFHMHHFFNIHHMEFYHIVTPSPLKANDPTPFHIQAEVTMKTNFFGTRDVCTELLPLMKPQGE